MIGWLHPAALGWMALLAVPIVVHLLRTHRAERMFFPSLRFVSPSSTAAVRFRLPTDLLLLAVRLAIVAAAIAAAAGPVFVTPARVRAWNARTVRAVVVDSSIAAGETSVAGKAAGPSPIDEARDLAAAESTRSHDSTRIDAADLHDAVVQAAGWLATAPPARRELVVISTFRPGALTEADLGQVPAGTGVRLVSVGPTVASRKVDGGRTLAAPGVPGRAESIQLAGPRTTVVLTPSSAAQEGFRVAGVGAGDRDVERLLRAVATAGAPAPSREQPVAMAFGGVPDSAAVSLSPAAPRWMLATVLRMKEDSSLARAALEMPDGRAGGALAGRTIVATARNGAPIVEAAVLGSELLVSVGAPLPSLMAAEAARALLEARVGPPAHGEQEILRTSADVLSAWGRAPSDVTREAWRRVDSSDARWLWLTALALIGVEQYPRRPRVAATTEMSRAA